MKKLIVVLLVVVSIICLFQFYKHSQNKSFIEYLSNKYTDETFIIDDVKFDIKKFMVSAQVHCSEGIQFTIQKKGNDIHEDYSKAKYTYLIKENLNETLNSSELMSYIKLIDVKILDNMEYFGESNNINPLYYLTFEYNDVIKDKARFAEVTYDVINAVRNIHYNNIGTYLFIQDQDGQVLNLVIGHEDIIDDSKDIAEKIKEVIEVKLK